LLNLRGEGKNSREGSGWKIGGGRTGDGEGTMEEYNEGGRHPPLQLYHPFYLFLDPTPTDSISTIKRLLHQYQFMLSFSRSLPLV